MLRIANYDIVFREIPREVTLALNISGCPCRCPGCHSPHLQNDVGETLTDDLLNSLMHTYGNAVTCVCFMGGDKAPEEILRLAQLIRRQPTHLKTAWYSGRDNLPSANFIEHFDYIKLGRYIEQLGGLDAPNTNQKLYRISDFRLTVFDF
ncbi:MAG: anaerobic ribonucleoside-triphosphate reductase activating protein [Prevotellaceae bacterium]|jgi:anaerobic ribonucleoside-triphosphate reductase activating protein|nr:anaerobic ribonucleoside-triphosphate reductase activating protein [Prevotellaceae bacterium]